MSETSEEEFEVCRICHGEGTADDPLRHPCACRGSVQMVHEACLIAWLRQRNNSSRSATLLSATEDARCEICGQPIALALAYDPDAPARLSVRDVAAASACTTMRRALKNLKSVAMVAFFAFEPLLLFEAACRCVGLNGIFRRNPLSVSIFAGSPFIGLVWRSAVSAFFERLGLGFRFLEPLPDGVAFLEFLVSALVLTAVDASLLLGFIVSPPWIGRALWALLLRHRHGQDFSASSLSLLSAFGIGYLALAIGSAVAIFLVRGKSTLAAVSRNVFSWGSAACKFVSVLLLSATSAIAAGGSFFVFCHNSRPDLTFLVFVGVAVLSLLLLTASITNDVLGERHNIDVVFEVLGSPSRIPWRILFAIHTIVAVLSVFLSGFLILAAFVTIKIFIPSLLPLRLSSPWEIAPSISLFFLFAPFFAYHFSSKYMALLLHKVQNKFPLRDVASGSVVLSHALVLGLCALSVTSIVGGCFFAFSLGIGRALISYFFPDEVLGVTLASFFVGAIILIVAIGLPLLLLPRIHQIFLGQEKLSDFLGHAMDLLNFFVFLPLLSGTSIALLSRNSPTRKPLSLGDVVQNGTTMTFYILAFYMHTYKWHKFRAKLNHVLAFWQPFLAAAFLSDRLLAPLIGYNLHSTLCAFGALAWTLARIAHLHYSAAHDSLFDERFLHVHVLDRTTGAS